jgi:hypothetical protein
MVCPIFGARWEFYGHWEWALGMGMGMGMDWGNYGVLWDCINDTLHWGTCYGYNNPHF